MSSETPVETPMNINDGRSQPDVPSDDDDDADVEMEENVVAEWIIEDGWFVTAPIIPTQRAPLDPDVNMNLNGNEEVPGSTAVLQPVDAEVRAPIDPVNMDSGSEVVPGSTAVSQPADAEVRAPVEPVNINSGGNEEVPGSTAISQPVDAEARDQDVNMDLGRNEEIAGSTAGPFLQAVAEATSTTRLPRTTRFAALQNRADDELLRSLMNTLEEQVDFSAANQISAAATAQSADDPLPQTSQSSQFISPSHVNSVLSNDSGSNPPNHLNSPHSNGQSGNTGSETVLIAHHDLLHIIRSFEGLSANIQALIGQGGNSGRTASQTRNSLAHTNNAAFLNEAGNELEEASVIIHKKKRVEENRFHEILRNILVDHGLRVCKRRNQLTLKASVPSADIESYEAGRHEGPNLNDLRLDWTEPMSSQWNSAAIYILADHVLDRIRTNFYPDLKYEDWMTSHRIFEELKEKLAVSKKDYGSGAASNAPETDVDAAETQARYSANRKLKQTRNRRNMRRKTLYDCRLRIVQENLGSHPAWESALQLMHVIGDAAMSDDETDDERSTRRKKVVRRVEKRWASTPLENMLNTLDLYYSRFYWDGLQKPGPGPRDRLTTIVSESPRPIPKRLPGTCYSTMYLNSLKPYQRALLQCKRDMTIPIIVRDSLDFDISAHTVTIATTACLELRGI